MSKINKNTKELIKSAFSKKHYKKVVFILFMFLVGLLIYKPDILKYFVK